MPCGLDCLSNQILRLHNNPVTSKVIVIANRRRDKGNDSAQNQYEAEGNQAS